MIKKIALITYGYPCSVTPTSCTFVKELVDIWRQNNIKVQVINPIDQSALKGKQAIGDRDEYFPQFNAYSWMRYLPFLKRIQIKLAERSFCDAVDSIIDHDIDVIYSHFLNAGIVAAILGEKYHKRAFCAFGESTLWSLKHRDRKKTIEILNKITGFISVSTENTEQLLQAGIGDNHNIYTLPNGINTKQFCVNDKIQSRKELNLPENDIIGIFVGHFNERKGVLRVEAAAKQNSSLKMIYIGSGSQVPTEGNIIFKGKVDHNELHKYLNAADFFVLPTLAEGCCNAIIEALACGLPVISSNGRFNDDILNNEVSIRVDPNSIDEIYNAMNKLAYDSKLRQALSMNAAKHGEKFDIQKRAARILEIMDNDD